MSGRVTRSVLRSAPQAHVHYVTRRELGISGPPAVWPRAPPVVEDHFNPGVPPSTARQKGGAFPRTLIYNIEGNVSDGWQFGSAWVHKERAFLTCHMTLLLDLRQGPPNLTVIDLPKRIILQLSDRIGYAGHCGVSRVYIRGQYERWRISWALSRPKAA